jgi:hypothetical protein
LPKRRNHVAEIIHNNLVVYGGITNIGDYLKDIWTINLANRYWIQATIVAKEQGDRKDIPIAYHASAVVEMPNTHKSYKTMSSKADQSISRMYVFGGMHQNA